jgi:hypothetical protein
MSTTTSTAGRQLRRLIGFAALTAALSTVPAGAALADGAAGAGAVAQPPAQRAPSLPAHAKKVKPSGKAARSHAKNFTVGGEPFGVFDEILTRYAWQRLPSGYWVRASRVFHHVSLGGEYGYLWDYWNGSEAISYALCLPSTGCTAY